VRTLSRQCRRKRRFSGVSSYRPAAIVRAPAVAVPCGRYSAYTASPTSVQTATYDPRNCGTASAGRWLRARLATVGTAPGSIIAPIIETHAVTKNGNDPSSVATPMSIPSIRSPATTHDTAASASVAAPGADAIEARAPIRRALSGSTLYSTMTRFT
jgi:hypothetical protein